MWGQCQGLLECAGLEGDKWLLWGLHSAADAQ